MYEFCLFFYWCDLKFIHGCVGFSKESLKFEFVLDFFGSWYSILCIFTELTESSHELS